MPDEEDDGHDFSRDVQINKYKLDVECERHAATYHYWAIQLAHAKADVDDAEDKLKLTLAQEEQRVREEAVKAAIKITEAGVKAELEDSPKVTKMRDNLRKANRAVYILQASVNSMDHRRSELDNLTKLWQGGYFSVPNGQERGTVADTRKETVRGLNNKPTKRGEGD